MVKKIVENSLKLTYEMGASEIYFKICLYFGKERNFASCRILIPFFLLCNFLQKFPQLKVQKFRQQLKGFWNFSPH